MRPGLAATLLVAAATTAHGQDDPARLMAELMSGRSTVGAPFTLPDSAGHPRSLGEFRGKLVLLYFGYLSCPDVCPFDLAHIGAAIRSLGDAGQLVQPVFVTIDPARDTPALIGDYTRHFHPRFVALRGEEDETRRIARSFKVGYRKWPDGTLEHAAFTFLLDGTGRFVAFFPPGTPAERIAEMLREQLRLQR